MPQDVERVKSSSTESEVAAEQVKRFDEQDGTPRYQRPLYLFWTGAETVAYPICAACISGALPLMRMIQ